jgi:hypothetical protein
MKGSRSPDHLDVSFRRELGGCFQQVLTAARRRVPPTTAHRGRLALSCYQTLPLMS